MSSKDLKMRFESQFWRMNCQIFSWLLSSGARGGNGRSEMLLAAASGAFGQSFGQELADHFLRNAALQIGRKFNDSILAPRSGGHTS
jgi:hypothetical protein